MPLHDNAFEMLGNVGTKAGSFFRDNPLLTGATLVASTAGLVAGISTIRRRKKASTKRKRITRKVSRRRRVIHHVHTRRRRVKRRHITHSRPRHKGHSRVSFTTKDGRKVSFLSKR